MSFNPNLIAGLTLCAVLAFWFIFAAIFLLRKKPPHRRRPHVKTFLLSGSLCKDAPMPWSGFIRRMRHFCPMRVSGL